MSLFRVSGRAEQRARALDRIHVRCTVLGVVEGEHDFVVSVAEGELPRLDGVSVAVVADPLPQHAPTGLENDRPIRLAPDLTVRPPWVERAPGASGIDLVVPRGMAFGSGEHASTQVALLALHETWSDPDSFLDVGTGSGILLAYAAARGCPSLAACDVEIESVAAARQLVPSARVVHGTPEGVAGRFACVIANLTHAELSASLRSILARWSGTGRLVLSGTRGAAEAEDIARAVPARLRATRRQSDFIANVFG